MVSAAFDPHWVLVGPWYRSPGRGLPADSLASVPAIQMFSGGDFIARFLARPQHSLRYDDSIDVVQAHDFVPAGTWGHRLATLLALNAKGQPFTDANGKPRKPAQDEAVFRPRLAPSNLRKLYQPTHDRHYLVSCELHCNAPGFPRVDRRKVCEAGFVLRRRRSLPGNASADDIAAAGAPLRAAEAERYQLHQLEASANDASLSQGEREHAAARMARLASAAATTWAGLLERQRNAVESARSAFDDWQRQHGVSVQIEGWFPLTAGDGTPAQRGQWKPLLDAAVLSADPGLSGEQSYPLFALVPDPRLLDHDAAGRTLYYGVVPTRDLQHEPSGKPHFDDTTTYELRCYVRQHHPCPGRTGKHPDCHGPLTWSASSQPYRVAAPFDVLGSANRPVSIKMPDLRDLAAQAALRPRGKLSPVHFEQPQHMSPDGGLGGAAVCSFSIPLITIVALFVLNLFLPVVVVLFQLWFLLVFRFCIPPQIAASAGIDAALALSPPGLDFEVDAEVKAEGLADDANMLRGALQTALKLRLQANIDLGSSPPVSLDTNPDLDGLDNNALASIDQSFSDAAALASAANGDLIPPETGSPLVYEAGVTPLWPTRSLA